MGIAKSNGSKNKMEAVKILLSVGAIEECIAGGVYHNTGTFSTIEDVVKAADGEWHEKLQDKSFRKEVQNVLENAPYAEDCMECHSPDELKG